jgi:hypothetical protein
MLTCSLHPVQAKVALPRPILCRVRQRLSVFFKPYPIADVEIATAYRTFPELLGLGQSRSSDLLTDDGPARQGRRRSQTSGL